MVSVFSSPSLTNHPGLDEWVSVKTDGRIAIKTGKVDIGQRISTALAMIAAEELDVPLDRIDMIRTITGEAPDEGITSGSNSMMESGHAVRLATATARRHMLAQAAEHLGVDADTLEVEEGQIRSRDTNRGVAYEELQGDKPFGIDVDPAVDVKDPKTHRIVGEKIAPLGLSEIVTGAYRYLHDMKMDGMLHARVVRPPHYNARLESLDDDVVARLKDSGIETVRDGSFLAVAGADEYAVIRAAERLFNACDWDSGGGLTEGDVFESLTANTRESRPVENDGVPQDKPVPPLADPPANASVTLEARYDKPYHAHASMGPSAAAAVWSDDGLQMWSHSQGVYFLRSAVAEAFGVGEETVRIEHVPGAGCYGHNGADDAAFDAALVARALPGTPVLLKWTREEEHAWAPYATATSMKLRASLDADGHVIDWNHETYGDTFNMRPRSGPNMAGAARLLSGRYRDNPPPEFIPQPAMVRHMGIHRNLDPLYVFPQKRLVKNLVRDLPLRTSALRTLGAFGNVFALESFMDELAEAAGIDPVTFRLNHLEDTRGREVLEAVAARMDLNADDGIGRGIAFAQYKNLKAYAAVGVELEVTDAAEVKLRRAVLAGDAGEIVDRDGMAAQYDGGFLQAASWTIHEQVTWDRDGISSRDWETYPILGFDNVPEIETVLIERPGVPFLGAGEAVSGPTGAAIANAIYNATGLRLRRMPFTPDAIRAAAMDA
ncbi:MAG: molybdopterin cofactor-binding domain-containing protein [Alphaproteobacteria bacterium]